MYRIYLISNQTLANNQDVNISMLIVHLNRVIAYFSPELVVMIIIIIIIIIIIRIYWVVSFDRN